MISDKKWIVIGNPVSGKAELLKNKEKYIALLNKAGLNYDLWISEYKGHTIELARKAKDKGYKNFIALGGDGTLHEVINGLLQDSSISDLRDFKLGIIPVGTGNDWRRTFQIPVNPGKAIKIIKQGKIFLHDIGKIEFLEDGKRVVYFLNIAGLGYEGFLVKELGIKKLSGSRGKWFYLWQVLKNLFKYQLQETTIVINGEEFTFNLTSAAVAICKYNGGGLKQAPFAIADDGQLDITVINALNKMGMIMNFPRLVTGSLVNLHCVKTYRTDEIILKSAQSNHPIEADGEFLGYLPVRVTVLQKAIPIIINKLE